MFLKYQVEGQYVVKRLQISTKTEGQPRPRSRKLLGAAVGTYNQAGFRRRLPEFVAEVYGHVPASTASSGKHPSSQPCLPGETGGLPSVHMYSLLWDLRVSGALRGGAERGLVVLFLDWRTRCWLASQCRGLYTDLRIERKALITACHALCPDPCHLSDLILYHPIPG